MPQVPNYNPVPGVNPTEAAIPRVSEATPGAAFGENIGQAVEGLGKVTEQAGNEMFARAVSLQQLQNESDARDADTKYMIKAGELHANYSALQGKDAVDAYPKYAQDLEDERVKARNSLTNPMAQKLYDSSSLSTMGRSIFNGAGHAATENKQYSINTAKAQIDLDANTVENDPNNEATFNEKLDRTRGNAAELAGQQGFEPGSPQAVDLEKKATSKIWASRISGMSKTDPFAAATFLDAHKTELQQGDYDRVSSVVTAKGTAVGGTNIANDVVNSHIRADGTLDIPAAQLDDEIRAKAKAFAPDNAMLPQHAIQTAHGLLNQFRYASKQDDNDNLNIIRGVIQKGVANEQELMAVPEAQTAVGALHNKGIQLDIPGMINRFNSARDKSTNDDADLQLNGLRNNDVTKFLETDVTKLPLSHGRMVYYMDQQAKMKENPNGDPRVSRAAGWIRNSRGAELQALGIYSRTQANADDYDHYTGALSSALDVWQETHGKPPTAADVTDTIAPQLIQQQTSKGWRWNSQTPFYNQSPPDDFAEKYVESMKGQGFPEPTTEAIQRAYIRSQWMQLYGGKTGEAKP